MDTIVEVLFAVDIAVLSVLLLGAIWSAVLPTKRIWPPPRRRSWHYYLTWICFYIMFALNTAIIVLDWNSWIFKGEIRLVLGIPLALVGALLISWGISTLGTANTSGLQGGFISTGPYRFTGNPQYLGDSLLFVGLSIITNSDLLWITHLLLMLVFVITPLAEELWLEEQYGESYMAYRREVPRFL